VLRGDEYATGLGAVRQPPGRDDASLGHVRTGSRLGARVKDPVYAKDKPDAVHSGGIDAQFQLARLQRGG
jgi:hypothetical protein